MGRGQDKQREWERRITGTCWGKSLPAARSVTCEGQWLRKGGCSIWICIMTELLLLVWVPGAAGGA